MPGLWPLDSPGEEEGEQALSRANREKSIYTYSLGSLELRKGKERKERESEFWWCCGWGVGGRLGFFWKKKKKIKKRKRHTLWQEISYVPSERKKKKGKAC